MRIADTADSSPDIAEHHGCASWLAIWGIASRKPYDHGHALLAIPRIAGRNRFAQHVGVDASRGASTPQPRGARRNEQTATASVSEDNTRHSKARQQRAAARTTRGQEA